MADRRSKSEVYDHYYHTGLWFAGDPDRISVALALKRFSEIACRLAHVSFPEGELPIGAWLTSSRIDLCEDLWTSYSALDSELGNLPEVFVNWIRFFPSEDLADEKQVFAKAPPPLPPGSLETIGEGVLGSELVAHLRRVAGEIVAFREEIEAKPMRVCVIRPLLLKGYLLCLEWVRSLVVLAYAEYLNDPSNAGTPCTSLSEGARSEVEKLARRLIKRGENILGSLRKER